MFTPELVWTIFGAEFALRIAIALRVLLRRCPDVGSLTWMVVLLLVPILGPVLFLLIGDNQLGRRRAKRYERLSRGTRERALAIWRNRCTDWPPDVRSYEALAKVGTALSGAPPLTGNSLELLDDAARFLERLIGDIENAREHCHLMYYIWMQNGRGSAVAEALVRAARRGVACRVLVDGVGGRRFWKGDLPRMLRDGKIDLVDALPASLPRIALARLDLRNHRKIAVFDGRTGYCGSHNLTDETVPMRGRRRRFGRWLDATVRVEGPAVQALQTTFLCDWLLDREEGLPPLEALFPERGPGGRSIAHVISSGPLPGPNAMRQTMLAALFTARQWIVMSTPYFVPDEATKAALINASLRGVDVTLILPDRLDQPVVHAAGRAHFAELLRAGIRIFHHTAGLLHAKTLTIDGAVAMVGSANLDTRSFALNFETSLVLYDADFAARLRELQGRYIAESNEVLPPARRGRGWGSRLLDHSAQLLAPLL